MIFQKENNALIARRGGETLRIEAWGKDAFRVRAWMDDNRCPCDWALTETPATVSCEIRTGEESTRDGEHLPCAEIVNGRLRATVNFTGVAGEHQPLPEAGQPGMEGQHRRHRLYAHRPL